MATQTLKEYKANSSKDYDRIIGFLVGHNLRSNLKITEIVLKEVTVTGKIVQKNLAVVEEMFEDENIPKQILESENTETAKSNTPVNQKEEAKIQAFLKGNPRPDEFQRHEIPVGIVDMKQQVQGLSPEMQNTKDLLNGLKNGRNKPQSPGIFARIKRAITKK